MIIPLSKINRPMKKECPNLFIFPCSFFFLFSIAFSVYSNRMKAIKRINQKGTSNNFQFATPAPYQVRGKLQRESSNVKTLWIPAFAGMTFLEIAITIGEG